MQNPETGPKQHQGAVAASLIDIVHGRKGPLHSKHDHTDPICSSTIAGLGSIDLHQPSKCCSFIHDSWLVQRPRECFYWHLSFLVLKKTTSRNQSAASKTGSMCDYDESRSRLSGNLPLMAKSRKMSLISKICPHFVAQWLNKTSFLLSFPWSRSHVFQQLLEALCFCDCGWPQTPKQGCQWSGCLIQSLLVMPKQQLFSEEDHQLMTSGVATSVSCDPGNRGRCFTGLQGPLALLRMFLV